MCSASKPYIPAPPPPPSEPPRKIDDKVKAARQDEISAARARAGRSSTIQTGSLGVEQKASVAKRRSFGA